MTILGSTIRSSSIVPGSRQLLRIVLGSRSGCERLLKRVESMESHWATHLVQTHLQVSSPKTMQLVLVSRAKRKANRYCEVLYCTKVRDLEVPDLYLPSAQAQVSRRPRRIETVDARLGVSVQVEGASSESRAPNVPSFVPN